MATKASCPTCRAEVALRRHGELREHFDRRHAGRRRGDVGPPCARARFAIPGVVSTAHCYMHMSEETRAVLWAMGDT